MFDTVGWSGASSPHIQRRHIVHEASRIYATDHTKKSDEAV